MRIGLHRGASWISKAIRWQTRSEYSHASLCFSDCIIESMEGHGVRLLGRYERGQTVDLYRVAARDIERDVWQFAAAQLGKGYDWTMVLRFLTRRQESRSSTGKWFCSELVFASLQQAGVNLLERCEPWEVSPGLLAKSPLLIFDETVTT